MAAVTLDEAKDHLRILHDDEDTMIQLYLTAAESAVVDFINQPIPGPGDSPVADPPAPLKAAILLIMANLFENREAASEKEIVVNPTVKSLMYPYRVDIGI